MQGNTKIISLLNKSLALKLIAINQYFLHARMYRHWGLDRLAKKEYDESIGEMKHADKLIDRKIATFDLNEVEIKSVNIELSNESKSS